MSDRFPQSTRLTVSLEGQDYDALAEFVVTRDMSLSWLIRQDVGQFIDRVQTFDMRGVGILHLAIRTRVDMASKHESLTLLAEPRGQLWWGLRAEDHKLSSFGMKLSGGGAHQSKTMMFRELEALISTGASTPKEFWAAAIDENAIGKATSSTRRLTFKHLASLYGLLDQPPLTKALLKMWQSDVQSHRLQALLVALARDPLLRETAPAIMSAAVGQSLQYPSLQDALFAAFPERFSEKTLRSLAQNCASSWTQCGHLNGAVKKLRQRVTPTPATVAFAALIGTASGFGGRPS